MSMLMTRGGSFRSGSRYRNGLQGAGMGDWWSDITSSVSNAVSNINWNPTASPVFQQVVAPALNVAGVVAGTALVGAPVPVGSLINNLLGSAPGGNRVPAPAGAPYNPYANYAAPAPAQQPVNTAGGQAPAAAAPNPNMPLYLTLGVVGLAGIGTAIYLGTHKKSS